mgnify:FL=1
MSARANTDIALVVSDESTQLSLPSELRPIIPEGDDHLKLLKDNVEFMFGGCKLCLLFSVIDFGEYQGVELFRYYNVEKKRGSFEPPLNGDFLIDYFTLLPGRVRRRDRMSLNPIYNKITLGKVTTVRTNNLGKKLPESLWYSKVGKLLKLKDDIDP